MGRVLGNHRVNIRRRQIETEAERRVNAVESNSQNLIGRIDRGRQQGQTEQMINLIVGL